MISMMMWSLKIGAKIRLLVTFEYVVFCCCWKIRLKSKIIASSIEKKKEYSTIIKIVYFFFGRVEYFPGGNKCHSNVPKVDRRATHSKVSKPFAAQSDTISEFASFIHAVSSLFSCFFMLITKYYSINTHVNNIQIDSIFSFFFSFIFFLSSLFVSIIQYISISCNVYDWIHRFVSIGLLSICVCCFFSIIILSFFAYKLNRDFSFLICLNSHFVYNSFYANNNRILLVLHHLLFDLFFSFCLCMIAYPCL